MKRNYEDNPKRRAYKKEYNARPERKAYSARYSKTSAAKVVQLKFQLTERFQVIQKRYRMTAKARYGAGKRQAVKRGIGWEITFDEYEKLIKHECHYCDGPLTRYGHNLDRKDNNTPYTILNVVTCCGDCNRTKGDRLTYDEMVAVANLLKTMRAKS